MESSHGPPQGIMPVFASEDAGEIMHVEPVGNQGLVNILHEDAFEPQILRPTTMYAVDLQDLIASSQNLYKN